MSRNKGITLIALVITIIVLLILAGVAISMLSGENGILKKAAEAKTKTEEAQKEEDTSLIDMELTTHFIENNSKYNCRYGFITGFAMDDGITVKDKIQDLEDKLPDGYEVTLKYNASTKKDEEITNKDDNIATGMAITKNGKEVARTVVFGDTNCNGQIAVNDASEVSDYILYLELKSFQKVAANVYSDDEINILDNRTILQNERTMNQNLNIIQPSKLKRNYKKMQEFMVAVNSKAGSYKLEYNEEEDKYILKGVTIGTTFGTLKQGLPEVYQYSMMDGRKNADDTYEIVSPTKTMNVTLVYKQFNETT